MKTAIIGCGVIGNVHLEICQSLNMNVIALCDIDNDKANRSAKEFFPNAKVYTDYKKMLDEVQPDVVHICTPHYLHAQMIVYALNHGINALCEKPLCINEKEMREILETEKKSSAQLGVCLQNRYNSASVYAKKYLNEHKSLCGFGNMVWNRDKAYYQSADWRGKWSTEGGGVMINQALHTLDLMQWFLGMPEFCTATINNFSLKDVIEVEDTAMASFNGQSNFTFFATNASSDGFSIEINLIVDGKQMKITHNRVEIDGKAVAIETCERILAKSCYGVGHEKLFEEFYSCVKEEKKFSIDGEEAAKVMKLIFAIYKSNGEKIKI